MVPTILTIWDWEQKWSLIHTSMTLQTLLPKPPPLSISFPATSHNSIYKYRYISKYHMYLQEFVSLSHSHKCMCTPEELVVLSFSLEGFLKTVDIY